MAASHRRKTASALAMVTGAMLLGWVALEVVERRAVQRAGRQQLESVLPPIETAATPTRPADETTESPSPRPAPGSLVARIVIPEVGVDAVALEGIDEAILRYAVGHFPETALPGEPGNASFSAHRDSLFRNLRHIEGGEVVEVVTLEGVHTYRVEETRVVEPSQVEVLAPRGGRHLTLITCYPFDYVGPAPRRFVVHAHWLESHPRRPEPGEGSARGATVRR